MTTSAQEFIQSVLISWDSVDPWIATIEQGLSDFDRAVLLVMCAANGDDSEESERQILAAIRPVESVELPPPPPTET